MGRGFNIPLIGVRYTMGRGKNTTGRRVKIPWIGDKIPLVEGSIYHGLGFGYSMYRVVKIPWLRGSI